MHNIHHLITKVQCSDEHAHYTHTPHKIAASLEHVKCTSGAHKQQLNTHSQHQRFRVAWPTWSAAGTGSAQCLVRASRAFAGPSAGFLNNGGEVRGRQTRPAGSKAGGEVSSSSSSSDISASSSSASSSSTGHQQMVNLLRAFN